RRDHTEPLRVRTARAGRGGPVRGRGQPVRRPAQHLGDGTGPDRPRRSDGDDRLTSRPRRRAPPEPRGPGGALVQRWSGNQLAVSEKVPDFFGVPLTVCSMTMSSLVAPLETTRSNDQEPSAATWWVPGTIWVPLGLRTRNVAPGVAVPAM